MSENRGFAERTANILQSYLLDYTITGEAAKAAGDAVGLLLEMVASNMSAGCSREWRPMRTAPRDGTVVEIAVHGMWGIFSQGVYRPEPDGWSILNAITRGPYKARPGQILAWRHAHPEWNDE